MKRCFTYTPFNSLVYRLPDCRHVKGRIKSTRKTQKSNSKQVVKGSIIMQDIGQLYIFGC